VVWIFLNASIYEELISDYVENQWMSFSSSLYTILISLQSASLDSVSQFCSSELFLNTFTIVGLHKTSLVRHPEIQCKV
jgi:hypothetical protein